MDTAHVGVADARSPSGLQHRGGRSLRPRLRGGRLGRIESLPDLLPSLTYDLLLPFFGKELAREESQRAIDEGQAAA